MKSKILATFLFGFSVCYCTAQTQITIENGGTGACKAIITGEQTLPGHTIYRPADLEQTSEKGRIPVILFGNGGCINTSEPWKNYLNEIASHGYIVLAVGPYEYFTDDSTLWVNEYTASSSLLNALDWITSENRSTSSLYYNKIDLNKVAVMGQSCGGLQAIECSFDPRVTTSVVLNSGILVEEAPEEFRAFLPKLVPEDIQKVHAPTIYIIGGASDIAYPNATNDFKNITRVPAVMANLDVGHGGTYGEPHGGKFVVPTLAWLDWQLKGNQESSEMFRGEGCGLCGIDGWTIETKNFEFSLPAVYSQEIIRLYEGKAPGSEDWEYKEITYNSPWNGKTMVRNVVDPTLEVFRPDNPVADGSAVIVCPGGGNVWLSYQSEGTEVAEWLAQKGVTAFVLKYRLNKTPEKEEDFNQFVEDFFAGMNPRSQNDTSASNQTPTARPVGYSPGTADGVAALAYVKTHAAQYGIHPEKVGMMGFSAGAGVTMNVILDDRKEYQPDFAAPVYGGWLGDSEVPENAPPLFILGAADDAIAARCPDLFKAWIEAGIPAEIHIYSKGGHGFGMDQKGLPVDNWIERFFDWLKAEGF